MVAVTQPEQSALVYPDGSGQRLDGTGRGIEIRVDVAGEFLVIQIHGVTFLYVRTKHSVFGTHSVPYEGNVRNVRTKQERNDFVMRNVMP